MAEILFTRPSGVTAIISIDCTIEELHMTAAAVTDYAVEEGTNISDNVRAENEKLNLEVMISNTPITPKRKSGVGGGGPMLDHSHLDGAVGEYSPASLRASMLVQSAPRRRAGDPIMASPGLPANSLRDTTKFVQLALNAVGVGGAGLGALNLLGSVSTPGVRPTFKAQPEEQQAAEVPDAVVLQFSSKFDRVRAVSDELRDIVRNGVVCTVVTSLRSYDNMVIESMSTPRNVANANAVTISLSLKQVRIVNTETVALTEPVQQRDKAKSNRGNQPTVPPNDAEAKKANVSILGAGAKGGFGASVQNALSKFGLGGEP